MVDPDLGMRSGIESAIALNRGFSRVVDDVVGRRWFDEGRIQERSAGVLLRLARYVLIDMPASYFTAVLAHEVVGHGGRYRELDISDVDYGFEWPPPYGSGGGSASVNLGTEFTDHETAMIWTAGLETHALLQRRLALRWMTRGEFDYADALLLWWSFQIQMDYVLGSSGFGSEPADNDPRAYVRWMNASAGYHDVSDFVWTLDDLKEVYRLNALNPFAALAVFAQLEMLWNGGHPHGLPSLHLGPVAYLPALRTGLTPFGPEVHVENYLRIGPRTFLVDVARGDETFYRSWWSAGVTVQRLVSRRSLVLDADARLWRQPELQSRGESWDPSARTYGVAFSARAHLVLRRRDPKPISLVGEIGYKTRGFLEGYRMDASPIAMLGVDLPW